MYMGHGPERFDSGGVDSADFDLVDSHCQGDFNVVLANIALCWDMGHLVEGYVVHKNTEGLEAEFFVGQSKAQHDGVFPFFGFFNDHSGTMFKALLEIEIQLPNSFFVQPFVVVNGCLGAHLMVLREDVWPIAQGGKLIDVVHMVVLGDSQELSAASGSIKPAF